MNQIQIERRQFLQAGGSLVVSFALAGGLLPSRKTQRPAKVLPPMRWIPIW